MTTPPTCVTWYGDWDTPKTNTRELVIGTKHGIASFKIVTTGRRSDFFSGFDPIWRDGVDIFLGSGDQEFREHRYVTAQQKAAKKWAGSSSQLRPRSINDIQNSENVAVRQFWAELSSELEHTVEDNFRKHFQMVSGTIPGVSSAPRAAAKAAEAATGRANLRAVQEAHNLTRQAEDPSWGMF
jgi:hypothetical protein